MNDTINSAIAIAISILLAVLVYKDAKRKGRSVDWAVGIAALFPFFLPLYLLFRPRPRFLKCNSCGTENPDCQRACVSCETVLAKEGEKRVGYADWTLLDGASIFLFAMFPAVLIGSVYNIEYASKGMWLTLLLMDNLLAIVSIYTVSEICRRPLESIGLSRRSILPHILLAIPLSGFLSVAASLSERAVIFIASSIFPPDSIKQLVEKEQEAFKNMIPSDFGDPIMILVIFATIILAPIAEEIFFRGVLYSSLKRRFGIVGGLIFSSLLFAVVHGSPLQFFPLFLVGLALGLTYEKSGLLVASISTHSIFNAISLIMAYI